MTTIEIDTDVYEAIQAAIAARDEGMKRAEESDRSGWNTSLVDQAINVLAATGQPFSGNDIRTLLPDDIPGPLMGARFSAAVTQRRIRYVGSTPSTKENTHHKRIGVYVGRPQN